MTVYRYKIDHGDPHNDQLTMRASEEMMDLLSSVRGVLNQAEADDAPLSAALAVVSSGISQHEEFDRTTLASVLGMALITLCAMEDGIATLQRLPEERWAFEVLGGRIPPMKVMEGPRPNGD